MVVSYAICGGEERSWHVGLNAVRIGEVANLGPYQVGGATASEEGLAGSDSSRTGAGDEEAWWDVHGLSVQESYAMLNALEVDGGIGWPEPEEQARRLEEFGARWHGNPHGGADTVSRNRGTGDDGVDVAFMELDAWLDDREREPWGEQEVMEGPLEVEELLEEGPPGDCEHGSGQPQEERRRENAGREGGEAMGNRVGGR